MAIDVKAKTIIFVPGIFGWGPDDFAGIRVPILEFKLFPFPYFADALAQFNSKKFSLHEIKCGPVSSFHDRACELYAQIRGFDFDYGEDHSKQFGHARTIARSARPNVPSKALLPDWSEDNPVIFVAHSAGAHTCLALQKLLEDNFWRDGTKGNWIEAIICVSGVLNGSTLTYHFGCDPVTGVLQNNPGQLIKAAVDVANFIPAFARAGMNMPLWLEHWTQGTSPFVNGEDNLAYDLTLKGCCERNREFVPNKNTYYLSVVTSKPPLEVNPILLGSAGYQVNAHFTEPNIPLPTWGTPPLVDTQWQENDGAVSQISQRYPFTCKDVVPGEHKFLARSPVEKGKWYFEFARDIVNDSMDHLDPVFGAKLRIGSGGRIAQKILYQKLNAFLKG